MVGLLTYGKRKFEDREPVLRRILPTLHRAMTELLPLVDADSRAFDDYLAALGLPKDTAEEKAARHRAMQDGLKRAVEVPLTTMALADSCWEAMVEMARAGNETSRSDLEVGARALETGIWGAWRNVGINLPSIDDEAFRADARARAEAMVERAGKRADEVLRVLADRLDR
jgi:glutamate formiminotransferase/formiminotetrahydrofolate cyclodeaminase